MSVPPTYLARAASIVSFGAMTPMQARTPAERTAELSNIQDQLAPMLNRKFAQQGVGTEAQAIKAGIWRSSRRHEGERQAALTRRCITCQPRACTPYQAMQRQQMGLQTLGAQLAQVQRHVMWNSLALTVHTKRTQWNSSFRAAIRAYWRIWCRSLRGLVQRQGRHAIQWVALASLTGFGNFGTGRFGG